MAPTTPITRSPRNPPGPRPGMTIRASQPAMSPTTIHARILMTRSPFSFSPCLEASCEPRPPLEGQGRSTRHLLDHAQDVSCPSVGGQASETRPGSRPPRSGCAPVLLLHHPAGFLIGQPLTGLLVCQVPEVPGQGHVVGRGTKRRETRDIGVRLGHRHARQRYGQDRRAHEDRHEFAHEPPPFSGFRIPWGILVCLNLRSHSNPIKKETPCLFKSAHRPGMTVSRPSGREARPRGGDTGGRAGGGPVVPAWRAGDRRPRSGPRGDPARPRPRACRPSGRPSPQEVSRGPAVSLPTPSDTLPHRTRDGTVPPCRCYRVCPAEVRPVRRSQRAVVRLLVAALGVSWPLAPAWGHAALIRSSPPNGAVLAHAPAVIRAWFSEELDPRSSTLRLYDARRRLLATGGVDPAVKAHTVMRVIPPRLPEGTYVVQWYAVSADDGAVRRGSFRFSVRGGGATSPGSAFLSPPPGPGRAGDPA